MRVHELAVNLKITSKELIAYLRGEGEHVSTHLQDISDDCVVKATEHFAKAASEEVKAEEERPAPAPRRAERVRKAIPERIKKTYRADDLISCRSIVPWKLCEVSLDKTVAYHWGGYGDVEEVPYRDLQAMRRKDIIKDGLVLIEDPDLCEQWGQDIGAYKKYLHVQYPEEFFDLSDEEFKKLLSSSPNTIKQVIQYTAMSMIHGENYPSVQKINIIDEVLGTCIKEFL